MVGACSLSDAGDRELRGGMVGLEDYMLSVAS